MASKSSKAIPFVVLAIAFGSIIGEVALGLPQGTLLNESTLALLAPMGVSGAALSAIKRAAETRAKIPKEIERALIEKIERTVRTE